MNNNRSNGVVRILEENGELAGSGFLISKDGFIVTCSHVILDSGSQDLNEPELIPDAVKVILLADPAGNYTAKVLKEYWLNHKEGDVAILKIDEPLPDNAIYFKLAKNGNRRFKNAMAYSAVESGKMNMFSATCTIGDYVTCNNNKQWLQLNNAINIFPGCSGSAVIDDTDLVVAMVVAIVNSNYHNLPKIQGVAYATTIETLQMVCDALKLKSVSNSGIEAIPDICNFDLDEISKQCIYQLRRRNGLHGFVIRDRTVELLNNLYKRIMIKWQGEKFEKRLSLVINKFNSIDIAIKKIKQHCRTSENMLLQQNLIIIVNVEVEDTIEPFWQKVQTIFTGVHNYRYVLLIAVDPDIPIPADLYDLNKPEMNQLDMSDWVDEITRNCNWKEQDKLDWIDKFNVDCSIEAQPGQTELHIELIYDHLTATLEWLRRNQDPEAFHKRLDERLLNA